jgi:hypothetical protein
MNWAIHQPRRSFSVFKRGALVGLLAVVSSSLNAADPATATPVRKVDGFNRGTVQNLLGGENKAWTGDAQDTSVWLRNSFDAENRRGVRGYALRLDYNVKSVKERLNYPSQTTENVGSQAQRVQGTGFGGFTIPLMDLDARPYRFLSFWIKGDRAQGYTRRLRVEVFDGDQVGRHWIESISDRWEEVLIPLESFGEIRSLASWKSLTLVFDDGMTNKTGSLYLDDVEFRTERVQEVSRAPEEALARRMSGSPVPGDAWVGPRGTDASVVLEPVSEGKTWFGKKKKPLPKARFLWRWDSTALYLSVEVDDFNVDNEFSTGDLDQGDSVEVFLSSEGSELSWDDPAAFRIGFAPTGIYNEPQAWAYFQKRAPSVKEVSVSAVPPTLEEGYALEVKIHWAFLGVQPSEGLVLGMGVLVNDPGAGAKTQISAWGVEVDGNKRNLGRLVLQ